MNENKKIEFNRQWIGSAVKKLLQKENIYESDMEKIKYLRIGEAFNPGLRRPSFALRNMLSGLKTTRNTTHGTARQNS